MLKTLTQALSGQLNPDVNLVKRSTVASSPCSPPTDDALRQRSTRNRLKLKKTDAPLLKSILTHHHVVFRRSGRALSGRRATPPSGAQRFER